MNISINPEFEKLIPPLTPEELKGLEENIIKEGCRDPLVLWDGVLIDGHNRYKICSKNNISFNIIEKTFETELKAKMWIILNQFGRRNLSNYDRSLLALKMKDIIAGQARENQLSTLKQNTVCQKSDKREEEHTENLRSQNDTSRIIPIDTKKELATIAGVSHDTIHKVSVIEEKAPEEVKEAIKKQEISINRAYSDIKRSEKIEQRREAIKEAAPIENLNNKFNVIYADPPWKYTPAEDTRQIENHYPTMELEEIKEININEITEKDCVLFLWATASKLPDAIEVLKAWGFVYKSSCVWDKKTIGMGYWFRGQHELLLIGTKGKNSAPLPENRYSSVYSETKTQHSKKPDFYYEMIEKMCPNSKYLELFSRNKHNEKWSVWGNQV